MSLCTGIFQQGFGSVGSVDDFHQVWQYNADVGLHFSTYTHTHTHTHTLNWATFNASRPGVHIRGRKNKISFGGGPPNMKIIVVITIFYIDKD